MIDWDRPANSDFLLVSQFGVTGALYTCRPDLVRFRTGLKRIEREDEPRRVALKVMLRGTCDRVRLLESPGAASPVKPRRQKPADSLDMLLDTMCNAFGGIILLAVLVTLLTRHERLASHGPTGFRPKPQ